MKFIFDLDGTVTKSETLPTIANHFGLQDQINNLTTETINGNIPFVESFIRRVGVLGKCSVSETRDVLAKVELFAGVAKFIEQNSDSCIIATGNLDVWVSSLCERFNCKVYTSNAVVENDKIAKLNSVLKKEDIVRQLQAQGEQVVYIGDGNNDAEAMRLADFSIACGLVHWPARSVMDISDFAVFDETALLRLLNQMLNNNHGKGLNSLVLSCAGFGSRLGLNSTKALMNFNGKPFIQWQLQNFINIEDIRVTVGFQAAEVINTVLIVRRDIVFALNHDYFSTGTGRSLYLGSQFANEFIIAWDGDLLVHRDNMHECLNASDEYLGISDSVTEDAVFVALSPDKAYVVGFSRLEKTPFEWSGPARLRRDRISNTQGNVYEGLLTHLPLPAKKIKAFDIDTPSDYEYATLNFRSYNIEQ